ncbi:class I SAM-dependent methyltransferase [Pseudomonas sp.]|uniref:class I SAM-dependent methyltransferase n=1 Tax=Pseudomonas sp. TaxID=306 RepID=UPI0028A615C3|nr:class I SAM-dependent methyltransferase [Pseudomonas sp.]
MSHHPSADQIVDLYDRHASIWNKLRANHFIDSKWIERFASLLTQSANVLDLGCGSGQPVARYLIETGASVVGVDSSKQMIALCSGQFPAQEWIHADMRTLALNRQFDAIGEALGIFQGETLYHASLDPREYAAQLHDHGFELLEHVVEDADCGGHTVWLGRRLP